MEESIPVASRSDHTVTETQLLSTEARKVFEMVNCVVLCSVICVFGVVSNVVNMVIFVKQGLDTTINISFFGLAISDLCSLLTLLWASVCFNPLLLNSDVPIDAPLVEYLTGTWPHACFGRITCWITAYITAERCLCIAIPLKVKQIITPQRTTVLICLMFILNLLPFGIECIAVNVGWVFYDDRNTSLLTLIFTEYNDILEGWGFIFSGLLGIISFPAVIVLTAILVVKLRHQASWRQKTMGDVEQSNNTLKREVKTIKLVVFISSVLIFCYVPGTLAAVATFVVRGFTIVGSKMNLFWAIWSTVFVFEAFNSSINIFLYYKMSTKFKQTFHELFGPCSKIQVTF